MLQKFSRLFGMIAITFMPLINVKNNQWLIGVSYSKIIKIKVML